MLFGAGITSKNYGFRNLNKMKDRTEKCEKSKKNVENVVSLSVLGNVNVEMKPNEMYRLSINEHNIKVRRVH